MPISDSMGILKHSKTGQVPNGIRDILTTEEQDRFTKLQSVVDKGLATFMGVGLALREIRERLLFRVTHATFEAFVLDRWDMSKSHANRTIGAASLAQHLKEVGIQPRTEAVCRPMLGLTPKLSQTVWSNVTRGNPEPTASQVEAEVQTLKPAKPPAGKRKVRDHKIKCASARVVVIPTRKDFDLLEALREAVRIEEAKAPSLARSSKHNNETV